MAVKLLLCRLNHWEALKGGERGTWDFPPHISLLSEASSAVGLVSVASGWTHLKVLPSMVPDPTGKLFSLFHSSAWLPQVLNFSSVSFELTGSSMLMLIPSLHGYFLTGLEVFLYLL